jgi:hypothetical protein
MDTVIKVVPQSDDYGVNGIVIDGVPYKLDGQPPVAKQGSWGDLSWLYWR